MRVLSIDLDYATDEFANDNDEIVDLQFTPFFHWDSVIEDDPRLYDELKLNFKSVEFMWNVYTKALNNCKKVDFAYDHDAILYYLENYDDIEILNIDQHGDVSCGTYFESSDPTDEDRKDEFEIVKRYDDVNESNWVAWLHAKNKLKKYDLITEEDGLIYGYEDFGDSSRLLLNEEIFTGSKSRKTYKIDNYNFDYLFICLSPHYIPIKYWNIFNIFIDYYEEIMNKKATIIDKKYSYTARYRKLNKYLNLK